MPQGAGPPTAEIVLQTASTAAGSECVHGATKEPESTLEHFYPAAWPQAKVRKPAVIVGLRVSRRGARRSPQSGSLVAKAQVAGIDVREAAHLLGKVS